MIPSHVLGTKEFTPEQAERLTTVMMAIQPYVEELHSCNKVLNTQMTGKPIVFGGVLCDEAAIHNAVGKRCGVIFGEITKVLREI